MAFRVASLLSGCGSRCSMMSSTAANCASCASELACRTANLPRQWRLTQNLQGLGWGFFLRHCLLHRIVVVKNSNPTMLVGLWRVCTDKCHYPIQLSNLLAIREFVTNPMYGFDNIFAAFFRKFLANVANVAVNGAVTSRRHCCHTRCP